MSPRTQLRDAEALQLRARGYTYDRIARELGWADRTVAHRAVKRALDAAPAEMNFESKQLILSDLFAAKQAVWIVLETNHITISNGIAVRVDGLQIPDDGPVLQAVDRIIKIDQEIAKLTGAYEPVKTEVTTIDAIDARLTELVAEMALLDTAATAEIPVAAEPAGESPPA